MQLRPLLVLALLALGGSAALRAQAPAADATASPAIQPTVTVEMGDVGGKFRGQAPDPKKTRHYYIAAEPELWNFAPEGQDPVCGKAFPPALLLNRVAWKIRYVQYADANFTARVLPTERLGIMGPVLRGVEGEYLAITFLNRSWKPLSMHPHGVTYDKDSEGSYYKPQPGLGSAVAPNAKFTYVWKLGEGSGPRPDEPSSKAWLYHSHVEGDSEINLGLFGCIIVTDPKRARPDGTPADVDREMAALFMIFDESNMPDFDGDEPDERPANAPTGPIQRTWAEVAQFAEEGERHTINGRTFGNLNGLEMNEGEHVRWYLFGLGSEKDFHSAHWHGERVVEDGRRSTDVVELLPASMKVADMHVDMPGSWLLHCHVADHMDSGMYARFVVYPAGEKGASKDPESAFFGMPQSLQTLRLENGEFSSRDGATEINIDGQVTVPDPFAVAKTSFAIKIGDKTVALQPDVTGLCVTPEAIFLIKNLSPYGNGNVIGGTLKFELTLKGAGWTEALKKLGVLREEAFVPRTTLPLSLQIGDAPHSASVVLKTVAPGATSANSTNQ